MNEYQVSKLREYKKNLLVEKEEAPTPDLGVFLFAIIGTEKEAVDRVIYQAEVVHARR